MNPWLEHASKGSTTEPLWSPNQTLWEHLASHLGGHSFPSGPHTLLTRIPAVIDGSHPSPSACRVPGTVHGALGKWYPSASPHWYCYYTLVNSEGTENLGTSLRSYFSVIKLFVKLFLSLFQRSAASHHWPLGKKLSQDRWGAFSSSSNKM